MAVCTKASAVDTAHARSSLPAFEFDEGHLIYTLTAEIRIPAVRLSHANKTTSWPWSVAVMAVLISRVGTALPSVSVGSAMMPTWITKVGCEATPSKTDGGSWMDMPLTVSHGHHQRRLLDPPSIHTCGTAAFDFLRLPTCYIRTIALTRIRRRDTVRCGHGHGRINDAYALNSQW